MDNKLVITSIGNGKISYVEGNVVEVSIDSVKNRINEIDDKLNSRQISFESETESARKSIVALQLQKKGEIEEKKKDLDREYSEYEARTNLLLNEQLKKIEEKFSSTKAEAENLSKERAKLAAVLSNVPENSGITTAPVKPVNKKLIF